MDKPIFGEKKQFADYQTRYAAYIVIERDQQIAVIEAPNGAFFLPGGETQNKICIFLFLFAIGRFSFLWFFEVVTSVFLI